MELIEQKVLAVLSTLEIDGVNVTITEQLDRKLYQAVNKVLECIGGKWNRKAKAHVFDLDPTDRLNNVIECGVLDPKVKTGYFPTPPELVKRMIELAELEPEHLILEPSAGQGHIADEIINSVGTLKHYLCMCETLPENIRILSEKGYRPQGDFFEYAIGCMENNIPFDRILMNPPFEKQQDIDHVTKAFELLAEGGILVAIMSSGVTFRNNNKTVTFRENILDKHAALIEDNPEGAFKSSGTMVNTIMVKLVK